MELRYKKIFDQLDPAARANLNPVGVAEYERYKQELMNQGTSPEDIELILRGFIWDSSE